MNLKCGPIKSELYLQVVVVVVVLVLVAVVVVVVVNVAAELLNSAVKTYFLSASLFCLFAIWPAFRPKVTTDSLATPTWAHSAVAPVLAHLQNC